MRFFFLSFSRPQSSFLLAMVWVFALAATPSLAQDELDDEASQSNNLNVFLDCDRCDTEFLRQEITYINYVRDREDADIHLLITTQNTGSSGTEYVLDFIGLGAFSQMKTVLKYASGGTDTDDERRRGLTRTIVAGLIAPISQTPSADRVNVSVEDQLETISVPIFDPWKNWVFRIGVDGSADGQRSRSSWEVGGNLSATQTTEDWKIQFSFNGDYEERSFDISGETETFSTRDGSFSGMIARSLGAQWALGLFTSANTSSFANTNLSLEAAPAIEYNFYPYSESSRRELRTSYRINLRSFDYDEETIYGETAETLLHQSLRFSYNVKQPWGDANASVEFSNYLHDFSKNRISLFARVDFRIIRGLSLDVFGSVSRSEDQLFLAAEDPTDIEVLTNQRQLATTWNYRISTGVSYRFGSIYNNVVNSRFGGGGRRRH